jgi:dipeptidyl aminopeptidase/acylaminoacyl peptidase
MENYEAISLEKNGNLRLLSDRMGCTLEDNRGAYQEISPFSNLSADCPPTLIFHGDADTIVNMEHAVRFKKKADRLGADCTLQIVHNAGHGFTRKTGPDQQIPSADEIISRSVDFFTELAEQK